MVLYYCIWYYIIWHCGLDIGAEDGISKIDMEDKWGIYMALGIKALTRILYGYKYELLIN